MFVDHLKHVFLSAIHKKSYQMLKLINWFCFCNTDFRTCFKIDASITFQDRGMFTTVLHHLFF